MKISKTIYLILAIVFLISFLRSLFIEEAMHRLFIWEVNIWVYRIFRLVIAVVFMKSYLELRKIEKVSKENSSKKE